MSIDFIAISGRSSLTLTMGTEELSLGSKSVLCLSWYRRYGAWRFVARQLKVKDVRFATRPMYFAHSCIRPPSPRSLSSSLLFACLSIASGARFDLRIVSWALVCMGRYMAPEVALGKPYNGAADVYGEQRIAPGGDLITPLPLGSDGSSWWLLSFLLVCLFWTAVVRCWTWLPWVPCKTDSGSIGRY